MKTGKLVSLLCESLEDNENDSSWVQINKPKLTTITPCYQNKQFKNHENFMSVDDRKPVKKREIFKGSKGKIKTTKMNQIHSNKIDSNDNNQK